MSQPETVVIKSHRQKSRADQLAAEEKELEEFMKEQKSPPVEPKLDAELDPPAEPKEPEVPAEDTPPVSAEEETYKKRYGDLRRHAQSKEKELEDRIKELESKGDPNFKPPASEEEIEAWAEQFPDAAKIIKTIAEKEAKANQKDYADLEAVRKEINRTKIEQKIASSHPDFSEIRENDEFHQWVAKQPTVVQNALYDNEEDPDSIIYVLDSYKKATGKTKEVEKQVKKEVEKQAAAAVKSSSSSSVEEDASKVKWSESKVYKLTDAQYEKYAEEIDKAQREGKFLYDMQ